jgi:transporter family protein
MEAGILYAVIAGLFWGSSPVLVKRGLVQSDVSAATLYQQATILLTLILAAIIEGDLWSQRMAPFPLGVFVATGIVGAYLGRTLFVKSVAQIGASRAQSLNNSSPLITVLLAALMLGEALSPAVLVGVLLIIAGVIFVTKSEPEKESAGAARVLTVTSMLATLCYGIVPVMKKLGTDLGGPPVTGALVMHATGLVLLVTLGRLLKIELKWHKLPAVSFVCFVAAGVCQGVGSIFTLKALVYAPASVVAPIWSAQPIISFFSHQSDAAGHRGRDLQGRRRGGAGRRRSVGVTVEIKYSFQGSRFKGSREHLWRL